MDKRNVHAVIVLIFCISLLFCAQKTSKNTIEISNIATEVAPNTEATNVIAFVDPVIESATREILEMPTGDITKEMVLEITRLNLDGRNGIESLNDLKWFENLEILSINRCNINNLDGIQTLYSLQKLYFSWNQVTNLQPIRNLTNITELSFAGNPIDDYSPLKELTKIEFLDISDNDAQSTDLSFLSTMQRLETLYAHSCGVSDISVLSSLPNLLILDLDDNFISDISALENLEHLRSIGLNKNLIFDITPLKNHKYWSLDLHNNPIPEEDWMAFFYPIEENRSVTTIHDRINENMPEFTFKIFSYLNPEFDAYEIYSIEISDKVGVIQNISVAEFALCDQTCIPVEEKESLIFSLEDFNFDGYLDFRVFDCNNGIWREEWLYFVWNPDTYLFEADEGLNSISNATFDFEKQLIYGYEHNTLANYCYFTYQYSNDKIILIHLETEDWLVRTNEQLADYLSMASVVTDVNAFNGIHHKVYALNNLTDELELITDEFVIYDYNCNADMLVHIDVSSELGQLIKNDSYGKTNE